MILVDWISVIFVRFIFLISSIIIIYRVVYISGRNFLGRFVGLIILFIFSMIIIILSPNIVRILFGWDGLGLVSYCLVIFYQNFLSYNSGIVTVLCNRLGDVGLLIGIRIVMIKGRWNCWMLKGIGIARFIVILAAITKRAQIPFSTWLPIAMAAPTPVSALVHSSTLVTAGVYLMIRFNIYINRGSMNLLFFLSVLTIFMSGLMANLENDLKKIIALSTLRQLGLIIIILRIGLKIIAFYHLLTHAIFKSILFICAGVIIHLMINNQDIRLIGGLNEFVPFIMIRFLISSLALSGFPFLAGFYSKDFIMELIYERKINVYLLAFIVISLILTVSYSFRLYYYLFFNKIKFYRFYNYKEEKLMNISMMILLVKRIIVGRMLNWLFFFDYYIVNLKFNVKILSLEICFLGLVIGVILLVFKFINKLYFLNFYLRSIWFMNYMYIWIYNPVNILGVNFYEFDKTWIEFSTKNFLEYLKKFFVDQKNYKIYQFIYLYVLLIFILVLIY